MYIRAHLLSIQVDHLSEVLLNGPVQNSPKKIIHYILLNLFCSM